MVFWRRLKEKIVDTFTKQEINDNFVSYQYGRDNYAKLKEQNTFTNKNYFNDTTRFARIVEMGTSGKEAYLLPTYGTGTTPLKLGNSPGNNDKRFNIDLENRSIIFNCPNPTNNKDVANKEYVDNKLIKSFKIVLPPKEKMGAYGTTQSLAFMTLNLNTLPGYIIKKVIGWTYKGVNGVSNNWYTMEPIQFNKTNYNKVVEGVFDGFYIYFMLLDRNDNASVLNLSNMQSYEQNFRGGEIIVYYVDYEIQNTHTINASYNTLIKNEKEHIQQIENLKLM